MVDPSTLEFVYSLLQTAGLQVDWKTALDKLLSSLREEFVYDNVAVYLLELSQPEHRCGLRSCRRARQGCRSRYQLG